MAEPVWISDGAVRWTFDDADTAAANRRARVAADALSRRGDLLDIIVAARSVTAIVEPGRAVRFDDVIDADRGEGEHVRGTHHTFEVDYAGPDLADIDGLTAGQVVALHTSVTYTVAFIGFAPGFPYLLGLPEALRVPRLPTPREMVEAGSVGVADEFTGIYPNAGPGGWRILGRTDATLFDAVAGARLAPGDTVAFIAR